MGEMADPLMGPCGRCGKTYDEHPGGFCPDQVGGDGMVDVESVKEYVPADEVDPDIWIKDEGDFAFVGFNTTLGETWLRSQEAASWQPNGRVVINGSAQDTIEQLAKGAGLTVWRS